MSGTRRSLLKTGAAAVVIIGAGGAAWSLTRAPKRAREPWSKAGTSFGDARLDALAYAILAPNPHNMQPWRIRLDGVDALTVFCDPARLLPETDPPCRQMTIGFGCFLELLSQAAAEKGLRAEVTPFPEGEPQPILDARPVATVRLVPDTEVRPDPLFAAALTRRTNRAPFSDKRVDEAAYQQIVAASVDGVVAAGSDESGMLETLKTLARDAWRIEWALDRTRRETLAVTRIGKAEIEAAPYGITLNSPMLDALGAVGVLTREKSDQPGDTSYEQTLSVYEKGIDTAAAFVWTSTAANTRLDQLRAGRAWVRMQQAATLAGVAFHPLSQALQEFPEMAPAYDRAHELMAHAPGATVQMLSRLGYAAAPPPAPREALEAQLIRA